MQRQASASVASPTGWPSSARCLKRWPGSTLSSFDESTKLAPREFGWSPATSSISNDAPRRAGDGKLGLSTASSSVLTACVEAGRCDAASLVVGEAGRPSPGALVAVATEPGSESAGFSTASSFDAIAFAEPASALESALATAHQTLQLRCGGQSWLLDESG